MGLRVYSHGTASIRHGVTGQVHEIEGTELDWDVVDGDERQMGVELHYEAVLEHPELGRLSWGLWEYPLGVENRRSSPLGPHHLIDDLSFGLEHEPDLWADFDLPDDPFTIFMDSYHHTGDLLADFGGDHGRHLVNRMIFAQQITALEAYLGDTLLKAVLADSAAMHRLIAQDTELARERFSLAEIAAQPGLVERRVSDHLRSIVYHNLARVDFLYATALGIRIFAFPRNKAKLFAAISQRHDIVHRNGIDKDGVKLDVFTKPYVQAVADLIRLFAEDVERAVRARATT